jgi:hypothetical protein
VVETIRLESGHTGNRIGSSNLPLSASTIRNRNAIRLSGLAVPGLRQSERSFFADKFGKGDSALGCNFVVLLH